MLLATLPSYLPVYEELVARLGETFSMQALFTELATEVDDLALRSRDHDADARLELIAGAVERVVTDPRVEAVAVIDAFVAALTPAARIRIEGCLGPASARLSRGVEARDDADGERVVSPAAPPRLRPRPRRYSGRAPRRRRRL